MKLTPCGLFIYSLLSLLSGVIAPTLLTASPSLAAPALTPKLSADHVRVWLEAHRGVQRFSVAAQAQMRGESLIEVRADDQSIDVFDCVDVRAHGRRGADEHSVTHKRYQRRPPYALISAEWYEVKEGEARVGAWRALQAGQSRGEWREGPAQVIRRAERRSGYEGLELAQQLWRSPQRGRALSSSETLIAQVGAHLISLGQTLEVSALSWGREARYTLRVTDQRLTPPQRQGAQWPEVLEVKVIDDTGRVSRQLRAPSGQLLYAAVSDQLSLHSAPPSLADARSMTELLNARGVISEDQIQRAMSPAREALMTCSRQHNPDRSKHTTLPLWLHVDATGALKMVQVRRDHAWGDFERCVAHAVTALSFPQPTGGAAVLEYPLRFQPSRSPHRSTVRR